MRRIVATAAVLLAAGAFVFFTLGSKSGGGGATYKVDLDNAFGLVNGSDFKVAGVIAGTITKIDLPQKCINGNPGACFAQVTIQVNKQGFGQFHSDAFCVSRPQSLIGEYFLDCSPGTKGKVLKPGSTISVTHTQSTIPADLVQNIMRLPYRQRFSIIINELGAAVAARSVDLQTALRRADPALQETDNLLALLANDAHTIRDLNVNANNVITALANNNNQVKRFIDEANRLSTDSATQAPNITRTWQKLPGFLEQLRPAMQKLGAAADAQDPVFQNLNAAANNLHFFFKELIPFSKQSAVSLTCGENGNPGCPQGGASLGTAAAHGKPAIKAATPLVRHLNKFAKPVPELAQNLAITLQALDTRTRTKSAGGAVEPDPRSPAGGKGYTGVEALLQYAFNITEAISYYGPWGHLLGVDIFANPCSNYATPRTIAQSLSQYQSGASAFNPRQCYAMLGPNQPGVTTTDPSNPSGCVPDPGGYPVEPGYNISYHGAPTKACKMSPLGTTPQDNGSAGPGAPSAGPGSPIPLNANKSSGSGSGGGSSGLNSTIGQVMSGVFGGSSSTSKSTNSPASSASTTGAPSAGSSAGGSGGSSGSGGQAQQLLNYLLAP
jgi:virulence factor Mce-like protein